MLRRFSPILVLFAFAACNRTTTSVVTRISAPANLTYDLRPSGDPNAPAGIRLSWDAVPDQDLAVYNVYSSATGTGTFDLRGSTTSTTFDDQGIPDLAYYVTAVSRSGTESQPSNTITVDQRLRLQAPTSLSTTSLNGAIHLSWSDNAYQADPSAFKQYRVYSTSYSLDQNLCGAQWVLEGTTVSPEFLAAALPNGVSRCFGVSAESVEGYESLWSPIREDTPRPDARNVLLYTYAANSAYSGFRFYQDVNGDGQVNPGELGIVMAGDNPAADFWLYRDSTGALFMVPQRTGTEVAVYGSTPVSDLTSIDYAPDSGYSASAIEAVPGYGYVFQMDGGDGYYRYGAVRVTDVSPDYIIFDWSYQTDPGNPELDIHGGMSFAADTGLVVKRK